MASYSMVNGHVPIRRDLVWIVNFYDMVNSRHFLEV